MGYARLSAFRGTATRGGVPAFYAGARPAGFDGFCALVARVLRCRRCSLMLAGLDRFLRVEDAVGLPVDVTELARVALGTGIAGFVAHEGVSVRVDEAAERKNWPRAIGTYAAASFLSYPVALPDGTVGVINLTDRDGDAPFTAEDESLLDHLIRFYASTYDAPARREVLRLRGELRHARKREVHVQEYERQRLARDLHDDAGHQLTAAILRLDTALHQLPAENPARAALLAARDVLRECADHLHDYAFHLRPRLLTDLGLAPALRSLVRRTREATTVDVEFRLEGEPRRFADQLELVAFRVAQEALTNALKHAGASRVAVSLTFADDRIVVEVVDDGAGFDASTGVPDDGRECHGLRGMRERAELAGGTFAIQARPGDGTRVRLQLPALGVVP